MAIYFHSQESRIKIIGKNIIKKWLRNTIKEENLVTGNINIVIVNDPELFEINQTYLNHNYFTDIVTFDYREGNVINGDLFISFERVKENAYRYGETYKKELLRVILHGVLHIIGYDDRNDEKKKEIRKKENYYLKYVDEKEIEIDEGV